MKHSSIDEFAGRSPLSKVDPRVKLLALIAFLIVAALATLPEATIIIGLSALLLAFISMIPAKHLLLHLAATAPFILAVALSAFLIGKPEYAIFSVVRIIGSVLAVLIFAATTPMFDQIWTLQYLCLPGILTTMLLFTYRFIFVFIDELERMKLAREARGFSIRETHFLKRRTMSIIGQTLGMLFIRVNERATRFFDSLSGRGFTGIAKTRRALRFGTIDFVYGSAFGLVIILVGIIQLRVI